MAPSLLCFLLKEIKQICELRQKYQKLLTAGVGIGIIETTRTKLVCTSRQDLTSLGLWMVKRRDKRQG